MDDKYPTIREDISELGEFSTLYLAFWATQRYLALSMTHRCHYEIKCIVRGKVNVVTYEYEEPPYEPLKIGIEIKQKIDKPQQNSDNNHLKD